VGHVLETKETDPVLFSVRKQIGFITLNRPRALNALTLPMLDAILGKLQEWLHNHSVHAVVIHSTCKRSFCAGGDLRSIYEAGKRNDLTFLENIFRKEYTLNCLIHSYPKPYIAFINGIAMGGGLGISIHGSHCFLSEKSLLSMPETSIGFFPDIGATTFLNNAPGKTGLYLGLTGNPFQTADALYAKIGTHYVSSTQQQQLFSALENLPKKSHKAIDTLVKDYTDKPPASLLKTNQELIDALFKGNALSEIFRTLKENKTPFAQETLQTLKKRSSMSLCITFEQLKRGEKLTTFAERMQIEFNLAQHFIRSHDFFEGIRATIIDKDKTFRWQPDSLKKISKTDISAFFKPSSDPLEVDQ